jgi:hypothetical protein
LSREKTDTPIYNMMQPCMQEAICNQEFMLCITFRKLKNISHLKSFIEICGLGRESGERKCGMPFDTVFDNELSRFEAQTEGSSQSRGGLQNGNEKREK